MPEPLSPRVVNQQARKPSADHVKTIKTVPTDDKYAEAPPTLLTDPNGKSYKTGRKLGQGGFAICFEAEYVSNSTTDIGMPSAPSKVALKIVKTKMNKKVEDKVRIHVKQGATAVDILRSFGQSFKYIQKCGTDISLSSTVPSQSIPVPTSFSAFAPTVPSRICARRASA